MMINRMPYTSQSMNMVHKSKHGGQIWLGDYYAASNVPLLKQKDIKSVLTSAAMLGVVYPKDAQINHKTINAFDVPSYKMTPHFDEAFHFLDDALKRGNLLVHCAAGISRSTTFVLVYLMRGEQMTFKHGLDYVRSKRPIVCPNEGFQKELKRLELALKKNMPESEKQKERQKQKQKYKGVKSQQFEQKQAVLDFIKDEKKEEAPKSGTKMAATISGVQGNRRFVGTNTKPTNSLIRGNSVNYSKKISVMNDNGSKNIKQRESFQDEARQTQKLTKQFLTFKMETPKIVTIKK